MRYLRAAMIGVLLAGVPLASACAGTVAASPPGPAAATAPPPGSGPVLSSAPPGPARVSAARARLRRLTREAHSLRRRMWRLRMRRRQFLAQGMPSHAHRVHERIIALGWRLRRVQAAERALLTH